MTANPTTGWRRAGHFATVAGIFLIVGPLVGLVAFAASIAVYGLSTTEPGNIAATAVATLIYGLVFAHFFGGVPALLAGLVVATWASLKRRPLSWIAGGIVGGGIGALYFRVLLFGTRGGTDLGPIVVMMAVLIASVVASSVCTRLTQRWQGG